MGTQAVDHTQINNHIEIDMDAVNRELACIHSSKVTPPLHIDDCEGFFPFEINPRNETEHVLLHLNFLREELRQNRDLVYVEDLSEHLKANYGKLIPNIRKLLTKSSREGFQTKQVFVGTIHPAWHALLKAGFGMKHDNACNTLKVTIGKRWFFVELG